MHGDLHIPPLKIQPGEFAEKLMIEQLGRHENIFLCSVSA